MIMKKLDEMKERLFAHALFELTKWEYVSQTSVGCSTNYCEGGIAIVETGCGNGEYCTCEFNNECNICEHFRTCNFEVDCPHCVCGNIPHIREEMAKHGFGQGEYCYKFICLKSEAELIEIAKTLGVDLEGESEEWRWYKKWENM